MTQPSRRPATRSVRSIALLAAVIALIAVVAVTLNAYGWRGLRPATGTAVAMAEAADRPASERPATVRQE